MKRREWGEGGGKKGKEGRGRKGKKRARALVLPRYHQNAGWWWGVAVDRALEKSLKTIVFVFLKLWGSRIIDCYMDLVS